MDADNHGPDVWQFVDPDAEEENSSPRTLGGTDGTTAGSTAESAKLSNTGTSSKGKRKTESATVPVGKPSKKGRKHGSKNKSKITSSATASAITHSNPKSNSSAIVSGNGQSSKASEGGKKKLKSNKGGKGEERGGLGKKVGRAGKRVEPVQPAAVEPDISKMSYRQLTVHSKRIAKTENESNGGSTDSLAALVKTQAKKAKAKTQTPGVKKRSKPQTKAIHNKPTVTATTGAATAGTIRDYFSPTAGAGSAAAAAAATAGTAGDGGAAAGGVISPTSKKRRGRPPGSGNKKHKNAQSNSSSNAGSRMTEREQIKLLTSGYSNSKHSGAGGGAGAGAGGGSRRGFKKSLHDRATADLNDSPSGSSGSQSPAKKCKVSTVSTSGSHPAQRGGATGSASPHRLTERQQIDLAMKQSMPSGEISHS